MPAAASRTRSCWTPRRSASVRRRPRPISPSTIGTGSGTPPRAGITRWRHRRHDDRLCRLSPMVATAVLKRPLNYREARELDGRLRHPVHRRLAGRQAYDDHILGRRTRPPRPRSNGRSARPEDQARAPLRIETPASSGTAGVFVWGRVGCRAKAGPERRSGSAAPGDEQSFA